MDYEALADELGIPLGKIFKIKHLYFIITKEGLFVGYNFQDVERKLSGPEEEMIIEGIKHCIEEKEDSVEIEYPSEKYTVKGHDEDIHTNEIFIGHDILGHKFYYYYDSRGRMQRIEYNSNKKCWESNVVRYPEEVTFDSFPNWTNWALILDESSYPYTYYVIVTIQEDEYIHYEIKKRRFKNTLTDFALIDLTTVTPENTCYATYDAALSAMIELYEKVEAGGKWVL